MKKVAVLGSTGSIGLQTLDVIRRNRDKFVVWALSATGKNKALLEDQIREFRPAYVATSLEVELISSGSGNFWQTAIIYPLKLWIPCHTSRWTQT